MKLGFTLAEVLITLGIVGVVASMTLPTLNNNVQKQSYEAGAKKAYNIVSNAVSMYMVDQGVDDLSETPLYNNSDGLKAFVNSYFRVATDCGTKYSSDTAASCFSKELYSLDRSKTNDLSRDSCAQVVTVADGMAFCFENRTYKLPQKAEVTDFGHAQTGVGILRAPGIIVPGKIDPELIKLPTDVTQGFPLAVQVDINGLSGPNVAGRDVFYMLVASNGQIVSPTKNCDVSTQDGRNKCVTYYSKNAEPMPIGLLQYYGWKMKY